jgi:hypothetical protein
MPDARILLRRERDGVAERFRGYHIFVDGEHAGAIKRGETIVLDVSAGHHTLQAAIDWGRSLPVDIDLDPGEEVEVQCWTNARPLTALYWITLGRRRYLGLRVSEPVRSSG